MTTNERPAAVARALTGAGTAIAMISMVTAFQVSGAMAEQQAQADAAAAAAAASTTPPSNVRGQAVRVLDPSLLPEIVAAAPVVASASNSGSSSSSTAAAPAAPAAPAPAPAQPAPPANGTTAGSGG